MKETPVSTINPAISEGHKQTEVGVIPEDWKCIAIGHISNPVRGGSPRPAGDPKYFNGSFIPWLTVAALTNIPLSQTFVTETDTCLTEEGSRYSRTLKKGTLIIANSGATLGVAKILGIKCCANDGIAALLDIHKNVHPPYLAYFINTKINYLREVVATGNGQPNLNTNLISNIKFPLPPTKAEQEAIAKALSDADSLIESLEQLIAKKRLIKQGAMQELLTGKRRLPGFEKKKGYNQTEVGVIPEDWEIQNFKTLYLEPSRNGIYKSIKFQGSGTRIVNMGEMFGYEFISDQEMNRVILNRREMISSILKDGDLLFGRRSVVPSGAGKCSIVVKPKESLTFESSIIRVRLDGKSAYSLFYYYFFSSSVGRSIVNTIVSGTNIKGVRASELKELVLPVPTVSEQEAIAQCLSDMDTEVAALESKLAKYRQIKQGMMHNLLTGRIRLV